MAVIALRPTDAGYDVTTALIASARTYYLRLRATARVSMVDVKWREPEGNEGDADLTNRVCCGEVWPCRVVAGSAASRELAFELQNPSGIAQVVS